MRKARYVAAGYPHYVLQRGNYNQTIFEEETDYRHYLEWLALYAKKFSLKIWAYCLMNNHVHFVCLPLRQDAMAKTFNTLHMRYSQYFNKKRNVVGHLWQNRFHSCILDPAHALEAVRHIENNPVRAGIVEKAHCYSWSSAYAHVFRQRTGILEEVRHESVSPEDWQAYLEEKSDEALIRDLRENIKTGRLCGSANFIKKMEGLLACKLVPSPRGRPPKFIRG